MGLKKSENEVAQVWKRLRRKKGVLQTERDGEMSCEKEEGKKT